MKAHFILYVKDQQRSRDFYCAVLQIEPYLDVDGISEFELAPECILGVMPAAGIKRILGDALPDPASADGIPRGEIYLQVEDAQAYHDRALASGAMELSPLMLRNWGEEVAYSLDPDGHVLAFANKVKV
jgi:catechol 2,3-dioxygenase-like lactoylglutathione lyase family enzyme